MNRWIVILLVVVLALGAGAGGYWLGRARAAPQASAADDADDSDASSADAPAPVVPVKTEPLREGMLEQQVVAYGPVVAPPSDVLVVSVPFESRVEHLSVAEGQSVAAGAILGQIAPSPDTLLQVRQARSALAAAKKDAEQTRQLYSQKLATSADLLTAEQSLEQAQLKYDSLEKSGADRPGDLKASAAGIISKIDVQGGQTVPASAPIVEIASANRIVAQLGIEPEFASAIHPGDTLALRAVTGSSVQVSASVERVEHLLNPDTRLVNAYVSFPKTAPLMLDSYVRGDLTVKSLAGLIVPRDAVLPEDDGNVLFTVKDGKAVRHIVDVLLETDRQAVVSAKDLLAGEEAVVVGNYELDDGTAVSAEPMAAPATQPAADQNAARPAAAGAEARS